MYIVRFICPLDISVYVFSDKELKIRCMRCSWLLYRTGQSEIKCCVVLHICILLTFLLPSLRDTSFVSYVKEILISLNNFQVYSGSWRLSDQNDEVQNFYALQESKNQVDFSENLSIHTKNCEWECRCTGASLLLEMLPC